MSTSGSDSSTNIRLSMASMAICTVSTDSEQLSFSQPRSLVEMIMPREKCEGSMDSVSSSSRNSSQPPKSRTVGIQTELVGDKLSAIIEEVEQPSHLGMSHRKRRATHPLFHTQTSVTAGQSQRESYRVGPVVAEGRSVVVRDCHHKVTGQQYSLRVINKAGVFGHEDLVMRECELLRGLKHDNLVRMVDGWESCDEICMVAEHVEGTDLFDAVLHCRHFCESDATIAIRQLSMALVYLHAHKIVHRDVKLENIFLHQAGEGRWNLKLGGMGLAATASEPFSLVCGNIFYMAPEMIAETGYGTKLDVWAAGVVCCTLLSGIMPFGSNSKRATVSNIQKGRYAFLSPFWDNVSDKAKDFVCHLLVVSPCQRYMATQMLQHPWLVSPLNCGRIQHRILQQVTFKGKYFALRITTPTMQMFLL
ncbi:Serine/threonine-protein kinase DCLK3 [Geodia barretti]|uniref:Serine/threonine-protein kinase DCLK3 n=1 Tax=Geodia barretti TaxID=519541 RepID=A0AA35W6V5_GEOBA|nr:Serine/threonine-protein kinase DCLK3 [Geodia barretti]